MQNKVLKFSLVLAASIGVAGAQSASEIVSKVQTTQKNLKDVSFKLSGSANWDGGVQKIDLDVQSIPVREVARINFNAPDALADNVVVVDGKKVRNYLFLTNQITEQNVTDAGSAGGFNFNFSQFSDASALLAAYDVKLVETQAQGGAKVFVLEGVPKNGALERSRIWITEQGWRPVRFQVLNAAGKVVSDLSVTKYKSNAGLSESKLKALPRDAEVIRR